jgi:predicted lysophospholipase L1 biosynthesis ABC-type transport system permease subunit
MRVVGTAIFPESGDATGHLDDGAAITFSALHKLAPSTTPSIVRFTLASQASDRHALEPIRRAVAPLQLLPAQPPTTITSFGRTNNLPAIVALVMALVATATLTHAMVIGVRRRRREFAILESIGLVRRQRSMIVVASALTLASITAVIGIPIGIVAGRLTWNVTADALGIPAQPTISATAIAITILGLVALAVVVALIPAAIARRTQAVDALRAE